MKIEIHVTQLMGAGRVLFEAQGPIATRFARITCSCEESTGLVKAVSKD